MFILHMVGKGFVWIVGGSCGVLFTWKTRSPALLIWLWSSALMQWARYDCDTCLHYI